MLNFTIIYDRNTSFLINQYIKSIQEMENNGLKIKNI